MEFNYLLQFEKMSSKTKPKKSSNINKPKSCDSCNNSLKKLFKFKPQYQKCEICKRFLEHTHQLCYKCKKRLNIYDKT